MNSSVKGRGRRRALFRRIEEGEGLWRLDSDPPAGAFGQLEYPTPPLGGADSGFLDEITFEDFLLRAETLHEDHQQLLNGEHVSGPAADAYQARLLAARRFAGLTITTPAQVNHALASPDLQVHHGALVTCVYRPATAACRQDNQTDNGPGMVALPADLPQRRPHRSGHR
jgi:hypothetical protein